MERLSDEAIRAALEQAEGWQRRDEKWIERKYRFPTFPQAIAFVNRVAERSEDRSHHPLIHIDYRVVTLRLSTWSAGGLTQLDMDMAAECNRIYQESLPQT